MKTEIQTIHAERTSNMPPPGLTAMAVFIGFVTAGGAVIGNGAAAMVMAFILGAFTNAWACERAKERKS